MSFEKVCERCSDHNFFNLDSLMTPQDILKTRIKKYANDNFSNNKRTFILSKWAKGAPFSQEQIDEIRKASVLEKEEAKEHIQNSWAALGNNLPGDVMKESYLA